MRDLPRKTDPLVDLGAVLPPPRRRAESGVDLAAQRHRVVALAMSGADLIAAVQRATQGAGFTVAGAEAAGYAGVVLVDARHDIASTIASLRARARTDAAIIVVFDSQSELVSAAHAAGAFACIRYPFVQGELVGLIGAALDATAAKVRVADLTKELDLQSHLASIGRMSAGIAHELGNPLSVAILGLQQLRGETARLVDSQRLLRALATAPAFELDEGLHAARAHLAGACDPNDLFEIMEDTAQAYARIEQLLSSLRALVGQGRVRREYVDLRVLAGDVRRWAAEVLHGVVVEEEGSTAGVVADPTMLGQIVLNLVSNAAQAAKTLSAPRVRIHVYMSGGQGVISVRDNGPGIPEEMQDKIFEPFFTTRRGRGGTGLGLSLCREYARQMGAELSFWSVLGRGACFRVQLPLAER
jgi:signal transduction histidine kinase